MDAIKEKLATAKGRVMVALGSGGLATGGMLALPALAHAEGATTIATVTTSMTTAFTGFATQALDAIAAIVPVVLPIMGAMVVVSIGVKVFRRFAK